jgi:hypothetical protein
MFRFVDFGEVSEACAPARAEGEAAQLFGQNFDKTNIGVERPNFKANRVIAEVGSHPPCARKSLPGF